MLKKIKRFDRGNHVLVIDEITGTQWREPKTGPSTLRKATNFTKAAAKHVRSGRKTVSLEIVQERFEICSNCPDELFVQLDPERLPKRISGKVEGVVGTCTHRRCGCFIHAEEVFPNKLLWSTSACPRQHWKAQ
jgi:hypothetical protein